MVTEERITDLQNREMMSSGSEQEIDKRMYGKSCSMYLAALNAGCVNTLSPVVSSNLLRVVPQLPLRRAYSILSLITQNYAIRYARDNQSTRFIKPYFDVSLLSAQLVENVSDRVIRDLERDSQQILHTEDTNSVLVESGQREKGLNFIRDWLETQIQDYLIICDGYFGLDDLEVLKMLNSLHLSCEVTILTSKKHLESTGVLKPWSDSFREHWRIQVSDANPPDTTFVVAGIQGSDSLPIHDRWWLTKNSGLRLGTSLNGLGNRSSEISVMDSVEAELRETEVRQYISMSKRKHNENRVLYEIFTF